MTLREICKPTIGILCDDEIDLNISSKKRDKLVSCANMIYGELTEEYLPLRAEEKLPLTDGRLYYSEFGKAVKDVIAVYKDGQKVDFCLYPLYLKCEEEGEINVKYVYHAPELALDDEVIIPTNLTANTLAVGIASEYFYRSGLIDEALFYKNRYDNSLTNLTRKRNSITIKQGRRL